jgi:hypothetical protein
MSKRVAIALLWFTAFWVGYEVLWSVTGVPRVIGPIVAAAIAGFVAVDPRGLFIARPASHGTGMIGAGRQVSAEH